MPTTISVRAGSQEPINLQVLFDNDADGSAETSIPLTTVQRVEFHLKNEASGIVKIFKTSDPASRLSITDAPGGYVQFIPKVDTWRNGDGRYLAYILIYDAQGNRIPVPEVDNMYIDVVDSF